MKNTLKYIAAILISILLLSSQDDASELLIEDYLRQSGGANKIEQIKDLTIKSTLDLNITKFQTVTYFKYPNKILTIYSRRGKEEFRTLLLSNKMLRAFTRGVVPLLLEGDANVAKTNLLRSNPFHEFFAEKFQIRSKALSVMMLDHEEPPYPKPVIPIRFTSGEISWSSYYDIKTKLKVGSVWNIGTQIDDISRKEATVEEFFDFKTFGELKFPTKIRVSSDSGVYSTTYISSIEINTNISDKIFTIER